MPDRPSDHDRHRASKYQRSPDNGEERDGGTFAHSEYLSGKRRARAGRQNAERQPRHDAKGAPHQVQSSEDIDMQTHQEARVSAGDRDRLSVRPASPSTRDVRRR